MLEFVAVGVQVLVSMSVTVAMDQGGEGPGNRVVCMISSAVCQGSGLRVSLLHHIVGTIVGRFYNDGRDRGVAGIIGCTSVKPRRRGVII